MTNDNFSDHDLEQLLSSMPKQTDSRSKQEVWNSIRQQSNALKPKKSKPWLPVVITVAALFVLVLFVQSLLTTLDSTNMENASDMAATELSEGSSGATEQNGEAEESSAAMDAEEAETESAKSFEMEFAPDAGLLFAEDPLLQNHTAVPFSLTYQAVAFPVTLLIPNERIQSDFPDGVSSQLELYETYSSEVDEQVLGFDEYLPLQGTFSETDRGLEITLPNDHPYDMASASSEIYFNTLQNLFRGAYSQAYVLNEQGQPIEWDQVGPLADPIELSASGLAYSPMQNAIGDDYLVPYPRTSYDSFEMALNELQAPQNSLVEPILPSSITYVLEETEDTVTFVFDETLTADSMPRRDLVVMIESLISTAASFNKAVVFENWDASLYPLPQDTRSLVGVNKIVLPVQ